MSGLDRAANAQIADALQRLAREQDAMLQNDLIGMVRIRDSHAVWTNLALERMFGFGAGEMIGRPAQQLFLSPQDHARVRDGKPVHTVADVALAEAV